MLMLCAHCLPAVAQYAPADSIPTVAGDFNGDGKQELMWVESHAVGEVAFDSTGFGCKTTDVPCRIRFSDATIPHICLDHCIGGVPVNHGDLNGNGSDEIGLVPDWFTSCWRSYYVWTFSQGAWKVAIKPFPTHCIHWENTPLVEKDLNRKGRVLIHYSQFNTTQAEIMLLTKSVKIE